MSSSATLESTYAFALNDLFGENKIDKFELAKIGQATEHNYCGVNCGIMDQFASVFGKEGSLIRLTAVLWSTSTSRSNRKVIVWYCLIRL